MQPLESADLQKQVRSLLVALVRLAGAREAAVFRVHPRTHELALVATTDGFVAPLRWIDAVWKRQQASMTAGCIWRSGERGAAPLVEKGVYADLSGPRERPRGAAARVGS